MAYTQVEILEAIGSIKYNWGEFDCFKMVMKVRELLDLSPPPPESGNFDWVYEEYTESNFPSEMLEELLEKWCNRVEDVNYKDGDIVCILNQNRHNLGVIINRNIIYLGYKHLAIAGITDIGGYIKSVWRYAGDE